MTPLLSVMDLSKRFGGLMAVDHVNLTLEEGEFIGIIGPNGAGKTTLFHLITGFVAPTEGQVMFRGRSIVGWKPYRISRLGITRTFQIVKPFAKLNVFENVMVAALQRAPHLPEARRLAEETLEWVGLGEYRDYSAIDLPIGLKKKLEVAKALATQPSVLFLDEVMGGLTPIEVHDMIQVLRHVHERGVTLVMVEHVLKPIAELCSRTLVLQQGKLIADGPTLEVLNRPEVVDAYLGEAYTHVGD